MKNNKRLALKKNNPESFMILKNITKKNRVRDFKELVSEKQLKKVKIDLTLYQDAANEESLKKRQNPRSKLDSFIQK